MSKVLLREELIEKLEQIELWPELFPDLDFYLVSYIHSKDLELIKSLLNCGANPNPINDLDCYLTYLLYEYRNNKTLQGEIILSIMELLLQAGANPNRVWCNNYRAYDYAIEWRLEPVVKLLEKYSVDRVLREFI